MENNSLQKFRIKLQKRLRWAIAYNLFVLLIIALNRTLDNQMTISDMTHGFTIGFFVGI